MAGKTNDALGKDSPIGKQVTLALHQLKGNEELEYEFIVCEAKPIPGLMIAKKITATHKGMLTDATDSNKFPHTGICYFEEGALLTDAKGLGKAIQAQCADEPADFTKEINGYIKKLESRIENFGSKLARSLAKANEVKDAAGQKSELTNAKAMIAQIIKEAKPLAAVIDENPFVKTNFTGQLTTGLTQVAQAISRGLAT
jgi:hypothetical protein